MPEAKLRAMVKHRGVAEFAVDKFKQAYPSYGMDTILNECKVEIGVTTPDGTARQMPVTIAQLLSMTAQLDEVKSHCKECRANVADRDFGCIGKVNYPITSEAEGWLLARLPEDAKSPSLSMLLKFLSDLEIDGAPVDSLRTRAEIFESKTPAVRGWGGWFNKQKISSSQILHMLAFGGAIAPQQAQLYTKLLGLTAILSQPHPPSNLVEQFKTFACAIVMAGRLNAQLDVDG